MLKTTSATDLRAARPIIGQVKLRSIVRSAMKIATTAMIRNGGKSQELIQRSAPINSAKITTRPQPAHLR